MSDPLPWTRNAAMAALALVVGVWVLGLGLLATGLPIGWLFTGLAGWLTVGLIYSVVHLP